MTQTLESKMVPVVLYGSSSWKGLLNFGLLLEIRAISPEEVELFRYADTPAAAWALIRSFFRF